MHTGELETIAVFKSWLVENGAHIHPDVRFEPVSSGFNVLAGSDVPADATVVSIPFSLAVTPQGAKSALEALFARKRSSSADAPLDSLTERQLVCTYLCMHWIADPSSHGDVLRHAPYIDTLPAPNKLRTPLHFSAAELEAFRGSNLYGATLDRRRDWEAEWQNAKAVVSAANASWGHAFTWEKYLTASTYLSSRAFPSTVLSESPTLVTTPTSYPVLLPGIDALNHARAHPVSWVVSSRARRSGASSSTASSESSPTEPTISLVIHAPTPRGAELLNNYGPKPNAELVLGYGFALAHNPDDTIVLKIGGSAPSGGTGKWEVGRGARGAEPVWEAVLSAVRAQNADDGDDEAVEGEDEGASAAVEDELCAADMLAEMARRLYNRLPQFPPPNADEMRPEVVQMLGHYLEGQSDILQSLVAFAREKEERALQLAREQGLDIVDEEDEEGEE